MLGSRQTLRCTPQHLLGACPESYPSPRSGAGLRGSRALCGSSGTLALMDGSPHVTDVSFEELKRGGYKPQEVDSYLAELDELITTLRKNWRSERDRADALEANVAQLQSEASAPAEPVEETVGRALLLAQKAADEAIAAARAEAKELIEGATKDVAELLVDAEATSAKSKADAESEAKRIVGEARDNLQDAIATLTAQRDVLRRDVALLEEHVAVQRSRIRASLSEVERLLELPETFRVAEEPELDSMDPPLEEPHAESKNVSQPQASAAERMVRRSTLRGDATVTALPVRSEQAGGSGAADTKATADADGKSAESATSDKGDGDASTGDAAAAPEAGTSPSPQQPSPPPQAAARPDQTASQNLSRPLAAGRNASSADASFPPPATPPLQTSDATAAIVADLAARRPSGAATGQASDAPLDDSFLDELRRAVNEDGGLPETDDAAHDEAMRAFFDADLDDESPRSRFGRKG